MAEPITITDLTQAGRLLTPDPNQPRVFVTYNGEFSSAADVTLDFTIVNQQGVFGVPRAIFVDNGSNPSEVEVSVTNTDQYFTVPPFAQGVFKIDAQLQSKINFVTDGGATDKVTITLYNWEVAPSVWYRFGAFNKDVPVKVQGTQPVGTDMDTAEDNNPVLTAGVEADGTMRRLLVDATGRLLIVGSGAGGQVYGPDADGVAPTQPPVLFSGLNGGNVTTMQMDALGQALVHIDDGEDVSQGAIADAANINPATSGTVISFLKGLLTQINAILVQTTTFLAPANSSITSVPDSAVNVVILASNAARKGATIYNNSDVDLYLALDNSTASLTSFSLVLQPQSYFEVPFKYTGEINGIWASNSTGSALISEFS